MNVLIEHWKGARVELQMTRARVILAVVIPALVLLASMDCFSNAAFERGCSDLRCVLSAKGHDDHSSSRGDESFMRTVQRWSRRVNLQSGSDSPGSGDVLAESPCIIPELTAEALSVPNLHLELAQSWQFHWRTASEPRAPSLVS